MTTSRKLVAEALGTAMLLAAVVGSGIMGERLAQGNVAVALLANTVATGAALAALILTFGPISGAHFNPAVTLCDAALGGLSWRMVPGYILVSNPRGLRRRSVRSRYVRICRCLVFPNMLSSGSSQLFSEFIATFGLPGRDLGRLYGFALPRCLLRSQLISPVLTGSPRPHPSPTPL